MPVIKKNAIKTEEVTLEGVMNTVKADVIGDSEGWTDNTLRVFALGPKGFTPKHQHDWEHVNYIIGGQGSLLIGEETFDLEPGDYAFVPPNTLHQFRNTGDLDLEFICIVPKRGAY